MESATSASRTERLRELHHWTGHPLVLPNVWDAASARIVEDAGYPAIATSSAGIAYSLGYPDGERVPPQEMFEAIYRIARAVDVPVTADAEAGYGDVAATARALSQAGAVGMNLEDYENDALVPLDEQVERIRTVVGCGVPMFINARTDIYLAGIGEPDGRYAHALGRLAAFRDAGAGCLFIPGLVDDATIGRFVLDLAAPMNILAVPGSPSIGRLAALGVARVSTGSGPMRATLALMRRIAAELRDRGIYDSMITGAIPYAEANRLFD